MTKNIFLTGITRVIIPAAAGYLGYVAGTNNGERSFVEKIKSENGAQNLDKSVYEKILKEAFLNKDFGSLSVDLVRQNVGPILDKADIKHGDSMFPSDKALSRRYLVSQWQRGAIGTVTSVIGRNPDGDLCSAMGPQRGSFTSPQGYGELLAPRDDQSGLHERGGSRFNNKTGEIVVADITAEQMAIREIEEELGITIKEKDLRKIDFKCCINERGIPSMVGFYAALLNETPPLKNNDTEFDGTEFDGDDMVNPRWVPVNKIKCSTEACYYEDFLIATESIVNLRESIKALGTQKDKSDLQDLINFKEPVTQESKSR